MSRWRAATAALLLGAAGSGCALLQPAAADAGPVGPPPPPALVLQVQAPAPLAALLSQHLDLARAAALPADERLDETELARLVAATPAQARELLQTEGYFDPVVTVRRETGTPPQVQVSVRPGERTRVRALQVELEGALAQRLAAADADARMLQAQLPQLGPLREGLPFRNPDWAETKARLLTQLRSAGHATAAIAHSRADIDTAALAARLAVTLDSGPLFRAGPLRIEGLKLHGERSVRPLAGFGEGAPLTESRLLDFQERLGKTGLFESATVSFEPDPAQADATPVTVHLREQPLQQATVGVGYSANTGPRASLEHTHRRLLGRDIVSYNKIEWGRDAQYWTADLTSHPRENSARDLLGLHVERIQGSTDLVLSQRLRLGRTTDTRRVERLYFAEFLRSRQTLLPDGQVSDARAYSGNLHLVLRDLDNMLLPTRGMTLSLQLGAGQARSSQGETGPFGRLHGRLTSYWPLGAQWYGTARVEAGQVLHRDAVLVPDALGFRAGGDDSVRGYGWRTLAPQRLGRIHSGDVLLTGSVELARPISERLPSVWGAVFVDAGRAAARWQDYRPAWGYGAGVRWRSPIGALRADLAWGDELRKLRLHLSVGIVY